MRHSRRFLLGITFGVLAVGVATTAMAEASTFEIDIGQTKEWEITNDTACREVLISITPISGSAPNSLDCSFFVVHDDETPTYSHYNHGEFTDSCQFSYSTFSNDEASSSTRIRRAQVRVYNSSWPDSEATKKTLRFDVSWSLCD